MGVALSAGSLLIPLTSGSLIDISLLSYLYSSTRFRTRDPGTQSARAESMQQPGKRLNARI